MADGLGTSIDWSQIPAVAKAMREAAPQHLAKGLGKAFYQIGKVDTATMRQQVQSRFKARNKGFINSFKFKAHDSRTVTRISELYLSEYTGAKPMRIFQSGGMVAPKSARTLTILTDRARSSSGRRKYEPWQLRALIDSGEARIIKTPRGAMIVREQISFTKKGKMRHGARVDVLAILRPNVHEPQRIDFFGNFDGNASQHEAIYAAAMEEALAKTAAGGGGGNSGH